MSTLESLLTTTTSATLSLGMAVLYCLISGILGAVVSFTYMKTGKVSTNFARTLIILPILVCVVISMVNGNLGTSVAILGAFSLVRFRSLQGNSRDIAYVFFVMAIGLTCSMGYAIFALVITLIVCLLLILLHAAHYGEHKVEEKDLRITIPENLDYTHIFDDLFEKYTDKAAMTRVKTTNMGSLYELRYDVRLKDPEQEKEFLDEIRCRNGNLTVIFGRKEYSLEEL